MKRNNLFFVYLAGPSGAGKTYFAKKLAEQYPDEFHKPLQVTTRKKRDNEKEGVDYNFITNSKYMDMLMGEELCCDTQITDKSSTKFYGTPIKNLSEDKINIIVVDEGGYSTRLNSKNEILIGLDYTYDEKTDKDRVIGREERDQRENFELLKEKYFMHGLYLNSSHNYISVDNFRKLIYKNFLQYKIYDPCFVALKVKV